jgi:hypothetical protein
VLALELLLSAGCLLLVLKFDLRRDRLPHCAEEATNFVVGPRWILLANSSAHRLRI